MKHLFEFDSFLNESTSEAEGKKAQMILNKAVEKYNSQRKTCFSSKTCPNLFSFTAGSLSGALSLVFTAGVIVGFAEGWGMFALAPAAYLGKFAYDELSAVQKEKLLPELKALYNCLGEDFFIPYRK